MPRRRTHAGDGAGILLQVPDEFLRAVVEFDLPNTASYATGIAFLPQSSKDAAAACEAVEKIAEAEGLRCSAGATSPPTSRRWGRWRATRCRPSARSFIAGASGMDLERRAYVVRKRAEHELGTKGPGPGRPGSRNRLLPKPFRSDLRLQGHADHTAAQGVLP